VKKNGKEHKIGTQLMAVVAEGKHGRIYISPESAQTSAAEVDRPDSYPSGSLPDNPRWFSPPAFGMTEYSDLFTNRQLTALTTFSSLVAEAQKKVEADAVAAGLPNDHIPLREGGTGARAYGEAVGVYLAFAVDRAADAWSSLVGWRNSVEASRNTFSRQALPMVWDYTEVNPFSTSCGNWTDACAGWIEKAIREFPGNSIGNASQYNAQSDCGLRNIMVSTDPPYYDNIGYADLSDFFLCLDASIAEGYLPRTV
jgi:putative DNA methylase